MIYVDTSAAFKLIKPELHSSALTSYLDSRDELVSSMLPDPLLRSLDAIHVATALLLGSDVDALVSYDNRMLAAAEGYAIPTACPT